MFFGVLNFGFCDLWWCVQNIWQSSYKLWFHSCVYNVPSLQCTEYSLLTVLYWKHSNWSMHKHCKQVWSRFSVHAQFCFIGFCFVFMLFYSIFRISKKIGIKKSWRFLWNSVFFSFLPEFCEFVQFSVSQKTGDFNLIRILLDIVPLIMLDVM